MMKWLTQGEGKESTVAVLTLKIKGHTPVRACDYLQWNPCRRIHDFFKGDQMRGEVPSAILGQTPSRGYASRSAPKAEC